MMWLVDLTARSSAVLALGLVLCALLHRRHASLRHFIVSTALCAAAAVLPLNLFGPSWDLPWPAVATGADASRAAVDVTMSVGAAEPVTAPVDFSALAVIVWTAGALGSLAMLLAAFGRLVRVSRRAAPVQDPRWTRTVEQISTALGTARPIALLQTDAPALLATWGVLRPRVLLPANASGWSEDRIRVVLCHEIAHIKRGDWLMQIGAEIVRAAFWFNPLFWLACKRLRRESEEACDDAVLRAGVPPREYASHLLELARTCRPPVQSVFGAVAMARPSTLERRIAAMLNPTIDRRPLSRRAVAITIALVAAVTLPAGAFRAAQSEPLALTGSVYDGTGAVLPQVSVTLQDAQQQPQQAVTDRVGRFVFPSVAPGRYVLEAKLAGFRTLRQELNLRTARDWDRAITLQVGEVNETISVKAGRLASPQGPSQPQPAQTLKVGGNIRPPRKVHDVPPTFPTSMREAGREGVVPMEAVIGVDGSVTSIRVLSADVHPDFAIAAADAVRQWRFEPTLLNGAAVEVRMIVSVEFKLAE